MFPFPPFPRPWSFLSKKPEGRSRGMTEVARLRDTKNFDQRLRLLPRSRRFNEEILLFNGGVKMKYRKRIFQELQLYGILRVSSHGRFTEEKFNDEIFSELYQPTYTLIGRVSSKFQEPNRPWGISIIRVSARYPTSTFHVASDDPTCTRRATFRIFDSFACNLNDRHSGDFIFVEIRCRWMTRIRWLLAFSPRWYWRHSCHCSERQRKKKAWSWKKKEKELLASSGENGADQAGVSLGRAERNGGEAWFTTWREDCDGRAVARGHETAKTGGLESGCARVYTRR